MRCIGHGGASALAPANTLRSFALAADLGADTIEFDVREVRGRLVLAHSPLALRRSRALSLESALGWLSTERHRYAGLVVDLKTEGSEAVVIDALRRHELLDRAVLASQRRAVLARVRALDPQVRTGISVAGRLSRHRQRWREWRDEVIAAIRNGEFSVLMAHRALVDLELVERVRATGAELHAWTVRGAADVATLTELGVSGIVTADPRLLVASPRSA